MLLAYIVRKTVSLDCWSPDCDVTGFAEREVFWQWNITTTGRIFLGKCTDFEWRTFQCSQGLGIFQKSYD